MAVVLAPAVMRARAQLVPARSICRLARLRPYRHSPRDRKASPLLQSQNQDHRLCSVPAEGLTSKPSSAWVRTLVDTGYICMLFSVWYMSNIYFNIFNKQVLTSFGHPVTCTWIHLTVGSLMACFLWLTTLKKAPRITTRVVDIIFPLAILHLIGFFTTNASLGAVAVSLTHTIKSMEPFFTVLLSWLLMGFRPAKRVLFSLLPIVAGVVVASATDISFNWMGFNAAMLSNLAFQTRNVLSKKAMLRTSYDSLEGGNSDTADLDEVNIFALMSIGACLLMSPFVGLVDGPSLAALGPSPAEWMTPDLWKKTILAGVCRFGDVLASFLILQRVTPVTHSVGNCVKRVVVIGASMIFFQTAASVTNIAGTCVALSGVLLYSLAKRSIKETVDHAERAVQTTPFEDALAYISPGSIYARITGAKPPTKRADSDDDAELEYYL